MRDPAAGARAGVAYGQCRKRGFGLARRAVRYSWSHRQEQMPECRPDCQGWHFALPNEACRNGILQRLTAGSLSQHGPSPYAEYGV